MRLRATVVMACLLGGSASGAHADLMTRRDVSAPPMLSPDQGLGAEQREISPSAFMVLGAQQPAAVTPEPSSFVLLGTGVAGVAGLLLRRRRLAGRQRSANLRWSPAGRPDGQAILVSH